MQSRIAVAARTIASRRTMTESTGDLDVLGSLQRTAALSPTDRAAAERAELTEAARSVAKVWLLRHQIEGVALPAGFLARHPEAQASRGRGAGAAAEPSERAEKRFRDYPERATVA